MHTTKKFEKNNILEIISLYQDIKSKTVDIQDLHKFKSLIRKHYDYFEKNLSNSTHCLEKFIDEKYILSLLMICLDYYTYSESGDVLISDSEYDKLHNFYLKTWNKELIIFADHLEKRWESSEHKKEYLVGSIKKVYSENDLIKYVDDLTASENILLNNLKWIIAPKFDGISACLEFRNGVLVEALTRGDYSTSGKRVGEVITPMVRRISNIASLAKKFKDGFLKVELLCPSDKFERIKNDFKNRRSATSAIVNAPKNIDYAIFLYAMPLVFDPDNGELPKYVADFSKIISIMDSSQIIKPVLNMMDFIRDKSFQYRVDGVVVYPILDYVDPMDIMKNSIAFKINTSMNTARILGAFISIGRSGMATPMVRIEPTEVNETIVEVVSIGSFRIFEEMKLMENERVIVYSAGDVIPQIKLMSPREYDKDSKMIKLPNICPFCNSELIDYRCVNENCICVASGRITNFIIKMGIEDISDGIIESLYSNKLIRTIEDIFEIHADDIGRVSGFGPVIANKIINRINEIRTKPVSYSTFFGSLGIRGCAYKTWETIFENISVAEFLNSVDKRICDINMGEQLLSFYSLENIKGVGVEKAEAIYDFCTKNKKMIDNLIGILNLVQPQKCIGNIVFSGFRDSELSKRFEEKGFSISDSVTKKTVLLVIPYYGFSSSNTKKAIINKIKIITKDDVKNNLDNIELLIYKN